MIKVVRPRPWNKNQRGDTFWRSIDWIHMSFWQQCRTKISLFLSLHQEGLQKLRESSDNSLTRVAYWDWKFFGMTSSQPRLNFHNLFMRLQACMVTGNHKEGGGGFKYLGWIRQYVPFSSYFRLQMWWWYQ